MKLFILLSRIPYPLEKGDKLRAFNQIQLLSKKHEIILVCLNDGKEHPEARTIISQYCKEVHFINLNKSSIYWNLIKSLFDKKPFQVNYFYHSYAQKKIDELIQQHTPDRIYCQLIRTSEYLRKFKNIPKTLDYMDVLSKGIERRIENANPILKPFFVKEYQALCNYERDIFNDFEKHTIISKQDQQLIPHPANNTITIIPNGVDTAFFTPKELSKNYELVFTGNMSYPPNVDSAVYLSTQIIPILHQTLPNLKLLLAGSYPALEILAHRSEHVHVSGWVDDIRECYASAKIFIAPMQIGTGLQNKLLEAMSMRIPCITSPLANNALGATPGKEVLIATTPEQYAEHVLFLLNNPMRAEELASNGYNFVQQNYQWDKTVELLEKVICS